jgi:predicted metalloprotease with PDZ domain
MGRLVALLFLAIATCAVAQESDLKIYVGMGFRDYAADLRENPYATKQRTHHAKIFSMEPDSPAISLLQVGDDIIEADGRPIDHEARLLNYFRHERKPGDVVQLTFVRDGRQMQAALTLGGRTPAEYQQYLLRLVRREQAILKAFQDEKAGKRGQ